MQSQSGDHWLKAIDKTMLTPLVRSALRSETVEVTEWDYAALLGGSGDQGEGLQGLCRFVGKGLDQGESVAWSLILKFSRTSAHGGDPQGGARERLAYQSGALDNLPGGIVAPRCFGVFEQPDELILVWLEEVTDTHERWPLERYGLVARHLGQFNGAYLALHGLPDWPWMSRGWLRHNFLPQAGPAIQQLASVLDHPLVRRVYPDDTAVELIRLWDERERFLDALDRLPQTFCHMDAFRRNLFAGKTADGQDQTVAIDWAFSGVGAVGEELAALIHASVAFMEVDVTDLQTLEDIAFNGYLEGLREAGWRGSEQAVRCGYTASAALRYGLGVIGLALPGLLDASSHSLVEQIFGRPMDEIMDIWGESTRYMVNLSHEARGLIEKTS